MAAEKANRRDDVGRVTEQPLRLVQAAPDDVGHAHLVQLRQAGPAAGHQHQRLESRAVQDAQIRKQHPARPAPIAGALAQIAHDSSRRDYSCGVGSSADGTNERTQKSFQSDASRERFQSDSLVIWIALKVRFMRAPRYGRGVDAERPIPRDAAHPRRGSGVERPLLPSPVFSSGLAAFDRSHVLHRTIDGDERVVVVEICKTQECTGVHTRPGSPGSLLRDPPPTWLLDLRRASLMTLVAVRHVERPSNEKQTETYKSMLTQIPRRKYCVNRVRRRDLAHRLRTSHPGRRQSRHPDGRSLARLIAIFHALMRPIADASPSYVRIVAIRSYHCCGMTDTTRTTPVTARMAVKNLFRLLIQRNMPMPTRPSNRSPRLAPRRSPLPSTYHRDSQQGAHPYTGNRQLHVPEQRYRHAEREADLVVATDEATFGSAHVMNRRQSLW